MLVRTRPSDRQQVIVTEFRAAEIESEWERHHQAQRLQQPDIAELEAERVRLRQKLNAEPKESEVVWSLLQKQRQQHLSEQEWSLYRNDVLMIAERLLFEESYMVAFAYLLDVCALDAWLEEDLERQLDLPDSRLSERFAPGVLAMLDEAIEGAGRNSNDIEPLLVSRRTKLPMLSHWQVTSSMLAASLLEVFSSAAEA